MKSNSLNWSNNKIKQELEKKKTNLKSVYYFKVNNFKSLDIIEYFNVIHELNLKKTYMKRGSYKSMRGHPNSVLMSPARRLLKGCLKVTMKPIGEGTLGIEIKGEGKNTQYKILYYIGQ